MPKRRMAQVHEILKVVQMNKPATAWILRESFRWGSPAITAVFLEYEDIIKYTKNKGFRILEDYIHGFDKHWQCGYMTIEETQNFPDEEPKIVIHRISEIPVY